MECFVRLERGVRAPLAALLVCLAVKRRLSSPLAGFHPVFWTYQHVLEKGLP